MSRPEFAVSVEDLRSGEKEVSWPLTLQWLERALSGTEASPRGTGELRVVLSLNGRDVIVRGHARAPLLVPCARTLEPVEVDVDAEVFLLLSPPSPVAERAGRRPPKSRGRPTRPGQKGAEPSEELTDTEVARDTYDGERVVLDDFVREFLVLELPMFPLRSDLRSEGAAAIGSPPVEVSGPSEPKAIDPRLAPLAAIASRLRGSKE